MRSDLLDAEIEKKGLSVLQLCSQTGISHSTYYRKRSGDTPFDTKDVMAICNALGITDADTIKNIFLS